MRLRAPGSATPAGDWQLRFTLDPSHGLRSDTNPGLTRRTDHRPGSRCSVLNAGRPRRNGRGRLADKPRRRLHAFGRDRRRSFPAPRNLCRPLDGGGRVSLGGCRRLSISASRVAGRRRRGRAPISGTGLRHFAAAHRERGTARSRGLGIWRRSNWRRSNWRRSSRRRLEWSCGCPSIGRRHARGQELSHSRVAGTGRQPSPRRASGLGSPPPSHRQRACGRHYRHRAKQFRRRLEPTRGGRPQQFGSGTDEPRGQPCEEVTHW